MDYNFSINGQTPFIFHVDDVDAADVLTQWRKDPKHKGVSKPGDDRSPAWTWQLYCNFDADGVLAIPAEYLKSCIIIAGSKIPHGRSSNLKRSVAAGTLFPALSFPLLVNGKTIQKSSFAEMFDLSFDQQKAGARKLGFDVFAKRASVGTSKHIRCRPRFDNWSIKGTIVTSLPELTDEVIIELFRIAGSRVGIGDWRPGAPKSPGFYGTFVADLNKA